MPTTTNNMARVHPAQPSYSVVVPAPELLSINVAVKGKIGTSLNLQGAVVSQLGPLLRAI